MAEAVSIDVKRARRLALARAGLLKSKWTGLPATSRTHGRDAERRIHTIIDRFGYLQLDAVSVSGARSHSIVVTSRLRGLRSRTVESLLYRGAPLFEFWGHEACWLPMELYPAFEFRRKAMRVHPWWGDLLTEHRKIADELLARVRDEGELRSVDMEGERGPGWWNLKLRKRVAEALWSAGELAIAARKNFQRVYDLPERVIPDAPRTEPLAEADALELLLSKALDGHGWATSGTLSATWRLRNMRSEITGALERMRERGDIIACTLHSKERPVGGWIKPEHLDLADQLAAARINRTNGVALSPFDPVLWDRARVEQLFGFKVLLEIYKPAAQRQYGYYVLPILVGEQLIGRVDLKADRNTGTLNILATHTEHDNLSRGECEAYRNALTRFASSVELERVQGLGALPHPQ